MEFEEIAAHFGYSLGVGAIPVKRFAYTAHARAMGKGAERNRDRGDSIRHLVAQLSKAGRARSKANRRSAF